jgi:hypothetical protein
MKKVREIKDRTIREMTEDKVALVITGLTGSKSEPLAERLVSSLVRIPKRKVLIF